jgi:hypothetical protein
MDRRIVNRTATSGLGLFRPALISPATDVVSTSGVEVKRV